MNGLVGNKLLLVITDPKPEELTADKEDDKKQNLLSTVVNLNKTM
jgi:hypothetical protein